jgi:hypothetical protein
MPRAWSNAFRQFNTRQQELNHFLWTTELSYGIIKHRQILETYPATTLAGEALKDVVSEAWFPSSQGKIKYKRSIDHMRRQLDKNFVFVLSGVAVLFVTYFEVFVQERCPTLSAEYRERRRTMPTPTTLMRDLQRRHPSLTVQPEIILKADLIKVIRNVYLHEGIRAVPRSVADPRVQEWKDRVKRMSAAYSDVLVEEVVQSVVGAAARNSKKALQKKKSLPEEFFYALFTFTDIRNFAEALEREAPLNA